MTLSVSSSIGSPGPKSIDSLVYVASSDGPKVGVEGTDRGHGSNGTARAPPVPDTCARAAAAADEAGAGAACGHVARAGAWCARCACMSALRRCVHGRAAAARAWARGGAARAWARGGGVDLGDCDRRERDGLVVRIGPLALSQLLLVLVRAVAQLGLELVHRLPAHLVDRHRVRLALG
eukprot:2746580-Prymnesium_polylepis.1